MADIAGRWSGIFSYPAKFPPTGFEAEFRQNGGEISGSISEPDLFHAGSEARATVTGTLDGQRLRFTKFYDAGDESFDTVHYDGLVDADATEITGRWTIPGNWSGSFIMVRATAPPEPAAAQESETVGAGSGVQASSP